MNNPPSLEKALETLAQKEEVLMQRVRDSRSQAAIDEIYVEYQEVHRRYADLAGQSAEAFKRALFLQWYWIAEPAAMTGIDIDPEAELDVMKRLNEALRNQTLDHEARAMLNLYFHWDYIYERFLQWEAIAQAVRAPRNESWPPEIDTAGMEKRGQMGNYWQSRGRKAEA